MNSARLPCCLLAAAALFNVTEVQRPARPGPLSTRPHLVHFATTCDPAVGETFDRAVTALHAFWFSEATAQFNRVLARDPRCAMAHWGLAMTDWGLRTQPGAVAAAAAEIAEAKRLVPGRDGREASYVGAAALLFDDYEHVNPRPRILAYVAAMKALTVRYPDDLEGVLFYALGILDSVVPVDKTYAARLEAGAILEREFKRHPDHPGIAHYLIHAYDVPPLANRALAAARVYARIAPAVPHALHMPSHVFTRLGDWNESIATNLRSAAAAAQEGPTGTAERLHALDYTVYADLQIANDRAALKIVRSLSQIVGDDGGDGQYGRENPFAAIAIPARYTLERHAWAEAARLPVHATSLPYADAITHFARALGFAHTGHLSDARREAEVLDSLVDALHANKDMYWAGQVDIERLSALGWIEVLGGNADEGLRLLRTAADREDATEKAGTTPGPLLPARELLADALLDTQPGTAFVEYQATLRSEPNRFRTVWGSARAAELAGRRDDARTYYRRLLQIAKSADGSERQELAQARAALSANP